MLFRSVLNPRDKRIRTFQTRDQIEAATPRIQQRDLTGVAASDNPQLVQIAPDHRVEAIVT